MRRRLRLATSDEGFTLIEVLVALVVFALVGSAAIGMLIAATRASLVAKMDTGAKNLAQERIEQLRNLPFHIDHNTGATAESDDLLDIYFKAYSSTNAACKTTGFVRGGTATSSANPPAGSVRCTYFGDPASGDFYRVAFTPVPGYPRYQQYVALQFLGPSGAAGAAYDVPTTYNTQGDPTTADQPPSNLVGARVTTLWTVGSTSKKSSIFNLISQGRPATTSVSFSSQAAALSVVARLSDGTGLTSQAGLLNIDGAATRNTVASTTAQGVYATFEPGDRINGSCAIASSSGATSACQSPSSTGLSLKDAFNNLFATFGSSTTSGTAQSTASSLPQVGTADSSGNPTSLVYASLDSTGSAPDVGGQTIYGVNNLAPSGGYYGDAALKIGGSKPIVYIDKAANSSSTVCGNASNPAIAGKSVVSAAVFSAGYGTTVGGVGHFASSCVASQVLGLRLFPTTFAPQGILQIDFSDQLICRTNGGAYSGSNPNGGRGLVSYSGTVRVWNYSTSAWGSPVSFGSGTTLAAAVPLSTVVYPGLTIGNYIASWGSASAAELTAGTVVDQDNNAVTMNYDSLVRISSTALKTGDPNSSFGLLLGNSTCRVEDNR